jgi:hypothetical protein
MSILKSLLGGRSDISIRTDRCGMAQGLHARRTRWSAEVKVMVRFIKGASERVSSVYPPRVPVTLWGTTIETCAPCVTSVD